MDRFHGSDARYTLDFLASLRLVSPCELLLIEATLSEHTLAACVDHAETIHLHVKMDDTDQLSSTGFEAASGMLDHARNGFVKYRMPGGINAIFSHIPISADDLRECASSRRPRPFLDHIGIDVRALNANSCAAFDALPAAAASRGWAHLSQGGVGRPVRCCHAEVDKKYWLFPPAKDARPIEIALGPLRHGSGAAGCDLRPSHPALRVADACCASESGEGIVRATR